MAEDEKSQPEQSSAWVQAKGVLKVGAALALYTQPVVALGLAVVWVVGTAVKSYREDTDHDKSFWQRTKEVFAKVAGVGVGTILPVVGAGIAAVGAVYAAYMGNDVAGASMQGAVVGAVVKTAIMPVVAAGLFAEGIYNMASGHDINITEKAIGFAKGIAQKIQHGLDWVLGRTGYAPKGQVQDPIDAAKAITENVVGQEVTGAVKQFAQTAQGIGTPVADAAQKIAKPLTSALSELSDAHQLPTR
jgi:hypothetical protein